MRNALVISLFSAAFLASSTALAGKLIDGVDEDHANHFRSAPITASDVTFEHGETFARFAYLKLRVNITNNSTDYFLVAKDGLRVAMPSGDFQPASKKGKFLIVKPNSQGKHGFTIDDETESLHQVEWSAKLVDTFRVSTQGAEQSAADFSLPLTSKSFNPGPFTCSSTGKVKQATDSTVAKFSCTYRGKPGMMGTINTDAMQIAIEDGTAFANEAPSKLKLMFPGDKFNFSVKNTVIQPRNHVDMQFAQLKIKWNDAFRETPMATVEFPSWEFELDESLTTSKND